MQSWINVPATDRIDDKNKMVYILLKTNISAFSPSRRPSFHFFIFGENTKAQKTTY